MRLVVVKISVWGDFLEWFDDDSGFDGSIPEYDRFDVILVQCLGYSPTWKAAVGPSHAHV